MNERRDAIHRAIKCGICPVTKMRDNPCRHCVNNYAAMKDVDALFEELETFREGVKFYIAENHRITELAEAREKAIMEDKNEESKPIDKDEERARIELEEEQDAAAAKVTLEKRIKALGRASLTTNIPARFIIGSLRMQADRWRDSLRVLARENERDRKHIVATDAAEHKRMEQRERAHENVVKSYDDAVEAIIRAVTQEIVLLGESGLDERGIDEWSDDSYSLDCDDDDPKATVTDVDAEEV